MKWLYIQELLRYLGKNKKRTAIAIAGIALGVLSLVLMSGISGAMRQKTLDELGKFGSRLVVVTPGELIVFGHRSAQIGNVHTLTMQDAQTIARKIDGVLSVATVKNAILHVKSEKRSEPFEVMGVDERFFTVMDLDFSCGHAITKDDLASMRKVAITGSQSTKDFFDSPCPLHKTLLIADIPFIVQGVLAPRGNIGMEDYDNTLFIPITLMQKLLTKSDWLDGIYILTSSSKRNKEIIQQVKTLLQMRHKKVDFTVMDYEAASGTSAKMEHLFFVLSIIVATIAYSVGVLGIIAIMALSIYERVIEIAIKRVVGATKRDLFWQFFLESLFLSFLGALFGSVVALLLLFGIEYIAHWPLYIPFGMLLLSTTLSVLIGMVASIYPATKAMAFEPVKILKLYEEL